MKVNKNIVDLCELTINKIGVNISENDLKEIKKIMQDRLMDRVKLRLNQIEIKYS